MPETARTLPLDGAVDGAVDHALVRAVRVGLHGVLDILERLLELVDRRRQRHRLAELDDRLLRDVGLEPGDVRGVATPAYWRTR